MSHRRRSSLDDRSEASAGLRLTSIGDNFSVFLNWKWCNLIRFCTTFVRSFAEYTKQMQPSCYGALLLIAEDATVLKIWPVSAKTTVVTQQKRRHNANQIAVCRPHISRNGEQKSFLGEMQRTAFRLLISSCVCVCLSVCVCMPRLWTSGKWFEIETSFFYWIA